MQSFYQLKKVKDWELTYVLKSSVAGKVSFFTNLDRKPKHKCG